MLAGEDAELQGDAVVDAELLDHIATTAGKNVMCKRNCMEVLFRTHELIVLDGRIGTSEGSDYHHKLLGLTASSITYI